MVSGFVMTTNSSHVLVNNTAFHDAPEPITICYVMANALIWILHLCWVAVVWKYLNSKTLERQTLMDSQIKVNMIAWLLVNFSFQTTAALELLGVRCHPAVAFIVTLTKQGSFLWFPILALCVSIMKYLMVKHPGILDNHPERLVAILNGLILVLVMAEIALLNVGSEGELPRAYYRLQRMQGKGSIKLYFWVMGGQFVILVGVSLFLHWKCSENTSINDHQPEEAPATSFSSRTLFKKMFPCYLVAILRPIVLVNLAASLDLIGWSKVGPVLISLHKLL